MAFLRSLALVLAGLAAAAGTVLLAAGWASGSGRAVAVHLALAVVASLLLVLSVRLRPVRPFLLSAGAGLLALSVLSAVVFPDLVRSAARDAAEGRDFCLLGPETSVAGDIGRDAPYHFGPAPRAWADLTFLTLPRPLMLAARTNDAGGDRTFGRPVRAFAVHDWSDPELGFRQSDPINLRPQKPSSLIDCALMADPFAAPATPDLVDGMVMLRPLWSGNEFDGKWGPPQIDHWRLPANVLPRHEGRFLRGDILVEADLPPLPGRVPLQIDYAREPAVDLAASLSMRVRDVDAPIDFAALAVNDLGLHAYEYPSSDDPEQTVGTYAAFAPDGAPVTVIGCEQLTCRHSLSWPGADQPSHMVITVTYPRDRLSDWRAVEAAAVAKVAAFLVSD